MRVAFWVAAALVALLLAACGQESGPSVAALLEEAPPRADLGGFAAQLDQVLPGLLAEGPAPGAAVAIVRGGRTAWVKGYGVADRASGAPVTAATRFQVASVSKPVTAWALMRLVETGRLRLDEPVAPRLTRWTIVGDGAAAVTVGQLLSHTAGFPEHQCLGLQAQPTPEACLEGAAGGDALRLTGEPGASFQYTNAGFLVAQLLAEETSGTAFPELLEREVLRPLGMVNADVRFGATRPEALATAYGGFGPDAGARVDHGPAGLSGDVRDLARFVAAMSGSGGSPGRGVLSPASVEALLTPAPRTEGNRGQDESASYGLGIALERLAGGELLASHKGNNPGWTALIAALPERGEGLVVLTNGDQAGDVTRAVLCRWSAWSARALPQRCESGDVRGG